MIDAKKINKEDYYGFEFFSSKNDYNLKVGDVSYNVTGVYNVETEICSLFDQFVFLYSDDTSIITFSKYEDIVSEDDFLGKKIFTAKKRTIVSIVDYYSIMVETFNEYICNFLHSIFNNNNDIYNSFFIDMLEMNKYNESDRVKACYNIVIDILNEFNKDKHYNGYKVIERNKELSTYGDTILLLRLMELCYNDIIFTKIVIFNTVEAIEYMFIKEAIKGFEEYGFYDTVDNKIMEKLK